MQHREGRTPTIFGEKRRQAAHEQIEEQTGNQKLDSISSAANRFT
jgi:hypothetical protein